MKWKCGICPATYVTEGARLEHEDKPHLVCPQCGEARVGLGQHIRRVHLEAPGERGRAISLGLQRRAARKRHAQGDCEGTCILCRDEVEAEGRQWQGARNLPRSESDPGYRSAMRDAGRGGLLR